jgi:hypothetical protein
MKKFILTILLSIIAGYAGANVPSATPLYNQYSCNGSATQFPYQFQITAPSDMQVFINNNAGTITQQPSSAFSVDQTNVWVNYPLTGSPCPNGSTITLQASTPITQITTYSQRTPFTASAVGLSFDKLTLIDQQLQGQLNRAILAPAGTSAFTFPSSVPSNLLGWDPAGSGNITNFVPNTGAYLSQATTQDAQTATNNTKYMTPALVATEVGYSGAVSIPIANVSGAVGYPGAGVANSTGSAWGTSYTVGTGTNNLVQLNSSSQLPAVSGALLTNLNTKFQVAFFTKDISSTTTTTVTGINFTPKAVVFFYALSSATVLSGQGADDGTNHGSSAVVENLGTINSDYNSSGSILAETYIATNLNVGVVTGFTSNGCTIGWTKTGTPTGTIGITALFLG